MSSMTESSPLLTDSHLPLAIDHSSDSEIDNVDMCPTPPSPRLTEPARPTHVPRRKVPIDIKKEAVKYVRSYIPPMFDWVPKYNIRNIGLDLIAGVTVGVMVIPQGLSFAVVAKVEPVHGLYAAMIASMVYFLFGSSRYLIVGPTAVLSLLVSGFTKPDSPPEVYLRDSVLLAFLAGIILMCLSFLRLGFLTNLLSKPISVGFTAAAAILITLSQLKYIFGIHMETPDTIILLFKEIIRLAKARTKVNGWAILMFSLSFAYIMVVKNIRWTKLIPAPLFTLIMGTLAAWGFDLPNRVGLQIVGNIPSGLPKPFIPVTSWDDVVSALPFSFVVAFISFVEAFTIGKPLAIKEGAVLKSNQELFALGASNLFGSFFGCFPSAGSFTRTAVNYSVGGKSQISGLVSGLIVMISILLLTKYLTHLPYAVLAAIVMSGVVNLFEFKEAKYIFKTKKRDFVVLVASFLFTLLLGIDLGVMAAIGLHILILVVTVIRMKVEEVVDIGEDTFVHVADDPFARKIPGVILVRVTDSLLYLNIDAFMKQVEILLKQHGSLLPVCEDETSEELRNRSPTNGVDLFVDTDPSYRLHNGIVFDFSSVNSVDSSAMMRLEELRGTLEREGYSMHFCHVHSSVSRIMFKGHFLTEIGPNGLFPTLREARDFLVTAKKKQTV